MKHARRNNPQSGQNYSIAMEKSAILKSPLPSSFFSELTRIKRSSKPLIVLSIFLSQFSYPEPVFKIPQTKTPTETAIKLFINSLHSSIYYDTLNLISYLDFRIGIGLNLMRSDYFLLYEIFHNNPNLIQATMQVILTSQNPLTFLSIWIQLPEFVYYPFNYPLNQTFKEDVKLLSYLFSYISKKKLPIHESLYFNFKRLQQISKKDIAINKDSTVKFIRPLNDDSDDKPKLSLQMSSSQILLNERLKGSPFSIRLVNQSDFEEQLPQSKFSIMNPANSSFYLDASIERQVLKSPKFVIDTFENEVMILAQKRQTYIDIFLFVISVFTLIGSIVLFWQRKKS